MKCYQQKDIRNVMNEFRNVSYVEVIHFGLIWYRNSLAAISCAKRAVDDSANAAVQEAYRAVGHQKVSAAGMLTAETA